MAAQSSLRLVTLHTHSADSVVPESTQRYFQGYTWRLRSALVAAPYPDAVKLQRKTISVQLRCINVRGLSGRRVYTEVNNVGYCHACDLSWSTLQPREDVFSKEDLLPWVGCTRLSGKRTAVIDRRPENGVTDSDLCTETEHLMDPPEQPPRGPTSQRRTKLALL